MSTVRASSVSGQAPQASSGPWWRFPIVWMVVAGPLLVVVASMITVYLAVKHVDPVLDITHVDARTGQAPAIAGRNHSAEVSTLPAER